MSAEAQEDILDRFTDPVKKQKKKRKREKHIEEKCKKICMSGKELADDHFNHELTPVDIKLIEANLLPTICPKTEILRKLETVDSSAIGFVLTNPNAIGIAMVCEFLLCSGSCDTWLQKQIGLLGFTKNLTNYNPISASHSISEVLEATVECYHMACKQMLRYLESVDKLV